MKAPQPLPAGMTKENVERMDVGEGRWRKVDGYQCSDCGEPAYANPYTNQIWGCLKCGFSAYSVSIGFRATGEQKMAEKIGFSGMNALLERLTVFLEKAALATFAGDGPRISTDRVQRPGFTEFAFGDGDWYYRDSYIGYYTSAGQEVVYYKELPLWIQSYGGGMRLRFHSDEELAHTTFTFLKMALCERGPFFQPRGPSNFRRKDFEYRCRWTGSIMQFEGKEAIFYRQKKVFFYSLFGGLISSRQPTLR